MKLNDFLLLGNNMIIPRDNWNSDTKVEMAGLPNENVCLLDETVFVSIVKDTGWRSQRPAPSSALSIVRSDRPLKS